MSDRIIFHIDVNSAFLSWEAVKRLRAGDTLDLREVPSVVGGDQSKRHGIVLAKSMMAKGYGIQTGESLWQAKQKCPNLVIVPPDHALYNQCSSSFIEILKNYSDRVEVYSVDECFLDFTGMERLFGDPVAMAYKIKDRIKDELGFTVNIGISENKLLAKMGGDLKKPDMVHTLFRDEIPKKMWPLPVGDLFMVGRATASKLNKLGIHTIGELASTSSETLKFAFKQSMGTLLWNHANGIDHSEVITEEEGVDAKGIGNSTTLAEDVTDIEDAQKILLLLVEKTSMRLRQAGFCCKNVSVTIKTSEFNSYSHQHSLSDATDCTSTIYKEVKELFKKIWKGEPIRLLGVRLTDFRDDDFKQIAFFEDEGLKKKKKIDIALDEIRLKYGMKSVFRSSLIKPR